MTNRRKTFSVRTATIAIAFSLLATTGAATDHRPPHAPRHVGPHGGPPPIEDMLDRNAERLGREPETRAALHAAPNATRAEGDRIRDALDAAHQEMRTLLSADEPNESAVMAQADRIGALETEAKKSRLRGMLKIRALLGPEQREILKQIDEERRGDRYRDPKRHERGPRPDRLQNEVPENGE
jgi:Spy/CpxP family protein refolding chaperone